MNAREEVLARIVAGIGPLLRDRQRHLADHATLATQHPAESATTQCEGATLRIAHHPGSCRHG